MKQIAVPYWPGSNGRYDVENRLRDADMNPVPLYFHIGNEERMAENAHILEQVDGAVIPGGFPYEDRLGFGIVPASMKPFTKSLRALVKTGKPVMAFCSGNQIGHAMNLIFDDDEHSVAMLPCTS